jgi:NifU-like protein involved in Fe-S cluster formation
MDHFKNPRNSGCFETPDAEGTAGVPFQGNFMVLQAMLDGDRVVEARFRCHGCGPSIAAGSVLTTLVVGRTLAECAAIDEDAVTRALGGLPPNKARSAQLAVEALRALLDGAPKAA